MSPLDVGVRAAPSGERSGIPLNTLQCTARPPSKGLPGPDVSGEAETPCLGPMSQEEESQLLDGKPAGFGFRPGAGFRSQICVRLCKSPHFSEPQFYQNQNGDASLQDVFRIKNKFCFEESLFHI